MIQRHLPWMCALAMLVPAFAEAQWGPQSRVHPAYETGYHQGLRAGTDDMRRGNAFNFTDESEYRRGDIGYRSQYGNRNTYRVEFRRGFQAGYQSAYSHGRSGANRLPPYGRATGRFDVATQQGYSDGYEAGVNDGRNRRQFDPIGERRYRSADRGYNRNYGDKEYYKVNYRTGFRSGYEAGYRDGLRYR